MIEVASQESGCNVLWIDHRQIAPGGTESTENAGPADAR
jgi:hypothetical protein